MPIGAGVQPVIAVADRGKATRGSLTTLVDASKSWPVDIWRGCALNLFLGSILATHRIASNTADTLTFEPAKVAIVAGVSYFIVGSVSIQAADVVIAAQTAGVYLQPEWAAKIGVDRSFSFIDMSVAGGLWANLEYLVPADKTLYLFNMTFSLYGEAGADRELNQMGEGSLWNATTAVCYVRLGGNGGGGISLPTPVVIPGASRLWLQVWNHSNHACIVRAAARGYEV